LVSSSAEAVAMNGSSWQFGSRRHCKCLGQIVHVTSVADCGDGVRTPSLDRSEQVQVLPAEYHTSLWCRIWYIHRMQPARKITVEIPAELLEKAQAASGTGITQTVRTGLQLVAASRAYAQLRQMRGKVRFTRSLAQLKADR
jgi:hypothetical protein